MCLLGLLWLISYVLFVTAEDPKVRLIGVGICGIANALANVSVILLSACFDELEKCISAYSAGSMSSALVVGFIYTGRE